MKQLAKQINTLTHIHNHTQGSEEKPKRRKSKLDRLHQSLEYPAYKEANEAEFQSDAASTEDKDLMNTSNQSFSFVFLLFVVFFIVFKIIFLYFLLYLYFVFFLFISVYV